MKYSKDYSAEIGKWLAEKREEEGLTQQEVADKLGHTRTAIHYWETGKRMIYVDAFLEYCRVLNVKPDGVIHYLLRR